jgi:hypothetical protein
LAFEDALIAMPSTTRLAIVEPSSSPSALAAEARETDLDVSPLAVTSPPKSETEATWTTERPTANPPSTVPFVPPLIAPVTTAPSAYDQLTTADAACGGEEIAAAEAGAFPGTTTRMPNALAEAAGDDAAAPDEPAETSATRRRVPRTTRAHT